MTAPVLELRGLGRDFGPFRAVDDVNLAVQGGTIHSVIGPNGAGKSTLFSMVTGTLRPSRGDVVLRGESIGGRRPHVVARKGLAQVFQMTSIFPRLTSLESVAVAIVSARRRTLHVAGRLGRSTQAEAGALLERVGIAHLADRIGGELSHGDKRALELAMVLATEPTVLLLDEPTAGMSPAETATTVKLIANEARSRGLTVLLSEHDMDVIFGISDHVTVLHQGRVIADGSADDVRTDAQVMAVYLGQNASGRSGPGEGPLTRRRPAGGDVTGTKASTTEASGAEASGTEASGTEASGDVTGRAAQ